MAAAPTSNIASIVKHIAGQEEAGSKHRVVVGENATLAFLRKALERDGVMTRLDGFEDTDGYIISKSSEAQYKWAAVKQVSGYLIQYST